MSSNSNQSVPVVANRTAALSFSPGSLATYVGLPPVRVRSYVPGFALLTQESTCAPSAIPMPLASQWASSPVVTGTGASPPLPWIIRCPAAEMLRSGVFLTLVEPVPVTKSAMSVTFTVLPSNVNLPAADMPAPALTVPARDTVPVAVTWAVMFVAAALELILPKVAEAVSSVRSPPVAFNAPMCPVPVPLSEVAPAVFSVAELNSPVPVTLSVPVEPTVVLFETDNCPPVSIDRVSLLSTIVRQAILPAVFTVAVLPPSAMVALL